MLFLLQFIYTLVLITSSKRTSVIAPIAKIIRQDNFMYLSKMDFGIGVSQITFQFKLKGKPKNLTQIPELYIGIIVDQKYEQLKQLSDCNQKSKLLQQIHTLNLQSQQSRIINISINQTLHQHIWYYYLYNCDQKINAEKDNYQLFYYIDITSLNNGSHFGENQKIIWVYAIALIISAILIPKNVIKLKNDIRDQEYDYAHICITIGIISLSAGYLYKFIHLLQYSKDGQGINAFDVLFLISRTISQSIVMALLIIIGWGWTITFIRNGSEEFFIPLGTLGGIINIITTTVGKISDDDEQKNHHYDCITGQIILFFRCVMVLIFLIGIVRTYRQARPKTKKFVVEFGIMAFLYISIYPIAVLFCEMVLPIYMQNEAIIGMTQITHAIANSFLTFMITSSKSSYTKLQYNSRSVFTTTIDGKVF